MRKIIIAMGLLLAMAVNVCAVSQSWSDLRNGAAEITKEAGVRYRIDLYRDGEDLNMTTTISADDKTSYTHNFLPYLIEQRGDGKYTFIVNTLDDNGNHTATSEHSEPFEYKEPEQTLDALTDLYFENGCFYFAPSLQEECAGYSINYLVYYDEETQRSYRSEYILDGRLEALPKTEDGKYCIDLESGRDRYEQTVNRYAEMDGEKYNPEKAKLAITVKALPQNILEFKSKDSHYVVAENNPFEKANKGKIRVDVTKYGKDIKNVIVLEIGKTYASVFGKETENDVAPLIYNGRTMLPIRFVAESLGAQVGWDAEKGAVTISKEGIEISIVVGDATATVNGEVKELDAPSFIDTGRTYMPVRFVAENLGATVTWDGETSSVIIE